MPADSAADNGADKAWDALRVAFAGNDDASAAWSQTSPDIKARCVDYLTAATTDKDRRVRAQQVEQLCAVGPIHEGGAGLPGTPDFLRYGFGGLLNQTGSQ